MDAIETIRKRQLAMALGVGIPYFTLIIGIFLFVYLVPKPILKIDLLGLPLHYWLVAVAVYPVTWGLFIWYVGKANNLEEEISRGGS